MAVEALVLDGHDRLFEDLGDVLLLHGDRGLVLAEDGDLVAVDVVDVAQARRHARLGLGQRGGERKEEEGTQHRAHRADGHEDAAGDEDDGRSDGAMHGVISSPRRQPGPTCTQTSPAVIRTG